MKRYLFIMAQEGHPWGGSEPLWSSAAEFLVRSGNEVRVSVKDWGKAVPEIEHLRAAGCKIFCRSYQLPSFAARQFYRIFPPAEFGKAHLAQAAEGVDLIVISQGANFDGLDWMERAHDAGHKYVVISQSAVVYWWPEDDRAERLKQAYEAASAAYFVSQANLELSRWQFASALANAKIVRNPFSVSYETRVAWPNDSSGPLRLACVGRLDVISKAQDLLLLALSLPHWRERNIQLSFVGTGPHERSLRAMARELGLTNVAFTGQCKNIENVWSSHHVLVLCSRFEGMPLVLVEAMLCGRPSVVTDVGGNRELLRDGVTGFFAKAPTVELVDEALNRMWNNRHSLESMGQVAASDARKFAPRDPGKTFAVELAGMAGETLNAANSSGFVR